MAGRVFQDIIPRAAMENAGRNVYVFIIRGMHANSASAFLRNKNREEEYLVALN